MTDYYQKYGRIGVLMGGVSSERDISIKSGQAVCDALRDAKCNVLPLMIGHSTDYEIFEFIRDLQLDFAFIALHGALGEDGRIQSILEHAGVVYPGSGVVTSRLCIDKVLTQSLLKESGLTVPGFVTVSRSDPDHALHILNQLDSFPIVVKPAREGSSVGISIVHDKDHLNEALQKAWKFGEKVLLENYIKGRELTVGILDQTPLPVVEIKPGLEFYDYEAKYQSSKTEYIVPADIPEYLAEALRKSAYKAHKVLGCSDLSRVDFMLDEQMNAYILEVNTVPGFTTKSLLPKAAQELGINFNQMCLKLMDLAYAKKEEKETAASST